MANTHRDRHKRSSNPDVQKVINPHCIAVRIIAFQLPSGMLDISVVTTVQQYSRLINSQNIRNLCLFMKSFIV